MLAPETSPLLGKEPAQPESAEPPQEDIGISSSVETPASEATIAPEDVEAAREEIPEQGGLSNSQEKLSSTIQGSPLETERQTIKKFSSRLNFDRAGRIEDMLRKIWPE